MKRAPLSRRCLAALLLAPALAAPHAAPALEPGSGAAPAAPPSGARSLPPPAAAAARPLPPAVEVTLPSGLRVVVIEHHRRPVLAMALVLPTGTLSELQGCSGTAQLAMQLASDFRETGPDGEPIPFEKSVRGQAIAMGGDVDSYALPDASLITVSGLPGDVGAYFKLLADAVERPRRGEESYRSRRDRLLDALEDLETADPEALSEALQEAAFGADSPYARPEYGTAADLARLGLEDVVEQQRRILVPGGATLVVVGDVKAGAVLSEARKAFRGWTGVAQPAPAWVEPARRARRGVVFLRREPARTLTVCAARPLQGVNASGAELEVLAALLGQGSRSRLMISLREEGGLAYAASAQLVRRRHARALLACAPVAGDRADEGVRRFRQVLEDLRRGPPGAEEVERARAQAAAGREAQAEQADGILEAWLEALVLGQRAPALERERADLDRVSPAALYHLARRVFAPGAILWIMSGDRTAAATAAQANGLGRLRPRSVQGPPATSPAASEAAGP